MDFDIEGFNVISLYVWKGSLLSGPARKPLSALQILNGG